ncbi:MAG: hypothetical protein HOQ29_16960 [Acidobacteria bacterium]|nr:hypothetical protein [Acidobacteriota bacterium]
MKRKLGMAAMLVVALAVSGYAQKKPDLSGTWTVDTEKSGAAPAPGGAGRGFMGMTGPITIMQTVDSVSIESQGRQGAMTRTYKLDGTETEIQMGPMTAKGKAKWDGDKLVIETTRRAQAGTPVTTSATYSLNADGTLTVVTRTPQGERKNVYKKTS